MSLLLVLSMAMFAMPAKAEASETSDNLQATVEQTAADYDAATQRVSDLNQQIDDTNARITQLEADLPAQQDKSNDAIRNLYGYQLEYSNILATLLSAESFEEVMTTIDYFNRIEDMNMSDINATLEMQEELQASRNQLESDKQQAAEEQDNAAQALAAAQQARENAMQQAANEAAAQVADPATAASAPAASDTVSDSANTAVAVDPGSTGISDAVSSDDVNWSADEKAFVDEWTARINAYLEGTELAGQGRNFAVAAWDYGVDPRWSPAISYVESSCGANCFRSYNAWGWGNKSWGSWDEAIDAHVSGLARIYGSTLTYSAAQKYCPSGPDSWYNNVLNQMNQI